MHRVIEPKILYFGTPVVLISTLNEDGSFNLAPISSAWWLDQFCMVGMGTSSKTVENLRREGECVLNLPSSDMVTAVDHLALTTGKNPVPAHKTEMGFRYENHKFEHAGLTAVNANLVAAPRVVECPVQLEAVVKNMHPFGPGGNYVVSIELEIIRTHIAEDILNDATRHYIDPDKWKPLIMSFCEFYGVGEKLHPSKLAQVF